jgi:hypothetical protein
VVLPASPAGIINDRNITLWGYIPQIEVKYQECSQLHIGEISRNIRYYSSTIIVYLENLTVAFFSPFRRIYIQNNPPTA